MTIGLFIFLVAVTKSLTRETKSEVFIFELRV